jgi:hypothetical protein
MDRRIEGPYGAEWEETPHYWDASHPGFGEITLGEPIGRAEAAYRLVSSMDAAQQALDQGERPLLYPPGLGGTRELLSMLPQLQEMQYAAPGGEPLFVPGPEGQLMVNPQWGQQLGMGR